MALSKTLVFTVTRSEAQLIKPEKLHTPREIKQLSDIDDQQGLRFLIPIIFFYPPLVGRNDDPVQIFRDGLAKALAFYYPFAGRVIEGPETKLMVDCNNDGVLFVEADANVKLEQLGHEGIMPPCPYMDELLCKVPDSHEGITGCPLWYFQVTRFICGGFSLGIRLNHTVADGYGIMLFLNAIRELIKGASTPSIPPVWQRELLNARSPPRITCTHNEYQLLNNNNNNNNIKDDKITYPEDTFIRTSIVFGPEEIQALRNQTNNHSASRFDLITACLWKCRTIALEPRTADEIVRVAFLMNARKKGIMSCSLPTGYYGNAITYPAAISRAGVLCESPLSYAVDLIQRAKSQMSEEYVRSVADLMVIKGRPMYVTRWNFIVSDITSLGFDKLDFGWGKPLFGGVAWATSVISFYSNLKNDKGENNGVVVPICLPALALHKFQYEIKKMVTSPLISRI